MRGSACVTQQSFRREHTVDDGDWVSSVTSRRKQLHHRTLGHRFFVEAQRQRTAAHARLATVQPLLTLAGARRAQHVAPGVGRARPMASLPAHCLLARGGPLPAISATSAFDFAKPRLLFCWFEMLRLYSRPSSIAADRASFPTTCLPTSSLFSLQAA